MPRGKKGNYALEADGNGRLAPVRIGDDSVSVPPVSRVQESEERTAHAGFAFATILLRTDGWLRVIPCGDGKQSYFKYKFNQGRWRNHYVMYVASYTDWSGGLVGLWEKVSEVDQGTRKPALDSYGGDGWTA